MEIFDDMDVEAIQIYLHTTPNMECVSLRSGGQLHLHGIQSEFQEILMKIRLITPNNYSNRLKAKLLKFEKIRSSASPDKFPNVTFLKTLSDCNMSAYANFEHYIDELHHNIDEYNISLNLFKKSKESVLSMVVGWDISGFGQLVLTQKLCLLFSSGIYHFWQKKT
jgi:hypothetical protein